jgi:type IV pilus assembly protein PilP
MRPRKNNVVLMVCVCLVGLLSFGGCKKKEAPPPAPAATQQNKQASKPVAAVQKPMTTAQVAVNTPQAYDFSSKKDPFRPYVIEQKAAKPLKRKVSAESLPIQRYEVMQFRVAGIIVGLKDNRAQIIDPAGKAYIVREGMLIGSNDGKVTKITASGIEVVELEKAANGKIVRRVLKLTLPKKG